MVLTGKVVTGNGISKLTVAEHKFLFKDVIQDASKYRLATININIEPYKFRVIEPDFSLTCNKIHESGKLCKIDIIELESIKSQHGTMGPGFIWVDHTNIQRTTGIIMDLLLKDIPSIYPGLEIKLRTIEGKIKLYRGIQKLKWHLNL